MSKLAEAGAGSAAFSGELAGSAALNGELMYAKTRKVAAKTAACLNKDFRSVLQCAAAIEAEQVTTLANRQFLSSDPKRA